VSVVSLQRVKTHLNITASTHDGELQSVIDASEAAIAEKCGPLVSTATTARIRGGCYGLVLPVIPAISLTSVTPADSTALTLADLYLDTEAGVVTYNSCAEFTARYYDVVYNAGRTTCPADLQLAVLEMVRHLWGSQRSPALYPGSSVTEGPVTPGSAYLMPYRVQELITPHAQAGFA
jgi:hypothetical protein